MSKSKLYSSNPDQPSSPSSSPTMEAPPAYDAVAGRNSSSSLHLDLNMNPDDIEAQPLNPSGLSTLETSSGPRGSGIDAPNNNSSTSTTQPQQTTPDRRRELQVRGGCCNLYSDDGCCNAYSRDGCCNIASDSGCCNIDSSGGCCNYASRKDDSCCSVGDAGCCNINEHSCGACVVM